MGNIYNSCRLPLRMKLAGMLLMGSISMGYGITERRQSASLFIEVNNESVQNVLKEIESQSEYSFFYDNQKINTSRKVSIRSDGEDVFSILEELFEDTNVTYKVLDNSIILSVTDSNPAKGIKEKLQSYRKVTGVITDPQGEPIIGANVVVKGTTLVQKEVTINKSSVYRVKLQEDTQKLDEVIVTALGIKREEKALGYSVQKVGSEELTAVKGTDVATSLTGKIAGLSINNSSEISEAPELQLRGENPLIVVDGVAYGNFTLSDISADDIESIDVLKGATASALYGVRGRAGAVMITTKRGKSGELTVNVSNNTMFQAGYLRLPEVQSSYSTGNYGRMEYNSGYVWGDYMDGREVEQYDPETMTMRVMPLVSKGRDNVKNFMRPGLVTNTNVNVSQSGELGGFRVSATQVHQNGQYPNSSLDKYIVNMSGNITYKKFKLDAGMSYKKMKSPNMPVVDYGGGNILYNMLIWGGTEYDIRDFKNYWKVPDQQQNWGFSAWYDNPYFEAYEKIKSINNFTTNGSLSFKYEILPWLKLQLRAGGVAYANNNVTRSSVGTISKGRGGWEDGALGYYKEGKKTGFTMNYDFFLLFNKKLSDFSVDGLLGGSLYYTKTKNLEASTKNGLSVPGFYSIKASVESPIVDAETKTKKVNSLFGTLTLGYKDTYYLEATGRNDWSSTLPSNDKSYFYPSVGVSIIPSNIISLPDWIPFWKLRGSWTVSKTDLAIYDLDRAYTIKQNVWDGLNTASYPDYLRGDVKPITNRTWEIGTGIHFLQGHRLKLDVSYFNKLTYNNTISQRISSATGYKSRLMNIDEEYVRRGVEISIDATPVQVRDFSWDVSLNLSTSKRYYAKLDENFSPDNLWTYVGARTDSYSYKGYDKDPDGNYIINTNGLMSRSQYSSLIGYTDPDLEYGLANVFKYKNFTLTLNFDGRIGGKSWSNTEFHMLETGAHPDTDNQWRYDEVVNGKKNYVGEGVKIVSGEVKYDQYGRITSDTRVFAPNDIETSYEDFVRSSHNNPDKLVQKKTFLKLREMSIGYNLPKKFISKLSMNSCYVGFIGQNLFVLTKDFRFSDPDGFEDIEGEDISSPSIRYVGVNLKVEF